MGFFIDEKKRRKSPIALAAFCAALLDMCVFGGAYALLIDPLYRTVSLGSETATTVAHTVLIALAGTAVCCLLFLLPDKRVAPYGFAGLAVVLAVFYGAAFTMPEEARASMLRLITLFGLAPVAVGNAVAWPLYSVLRRRHPVRKRTLQQELQEAVRTRAEKHPADAPAEPCPERPCPTGGPSGPGRSAEEEAMLLFMSDDEESDD